MVILVKNVFISLLSSLLQTCVQTLLEPWWNNCAESLVPDFWNYLWNIVTVFKDVCKKKSCKTVFVSVQFPSAAQVEVPLALRRNPSTGRCLNSHVGQSTPCEQPP